MKSRAVIIRVIGIVIITYNITTQAETAHKKKVESESYFIETLNYYFPWATSWVKSTPTSEDVEEVDVIDDYCIYPDEISRLMEAQKTYRIKLKDGWKIVPQKTSYSDQIAGIVVDEQGIPRVSYRGKAAIHDSYLYANCISRERGKELKAEMDNNNEKIEIEAYTQLKVMMGEEVFYRLAGQLFSLIYGDLCHRGYGSRMAAQVTPVLEWYTRTNNEKSVQAFLAGKFKDTQVAERLKNFIEMFVEHHDLAFLQHMCTQMDAGFSATVAGFSTESNLYLAWKKRRNKHDEM